MNNALPDWAFEFPGAITICDKEGVILYMNMKSRLTFAEDGGEDLIGKNLADCHPEPARSRVIELLSSGKSNVYTIEKRGIKKMIFQSPWYNEGEYCGLVEISLEIPHRMPHFVRTP